MKRLCAWCGETLGVKDPDHNTREGPVTHGICPDCVREALSFEATSLRDYLDRFSGPVFLVDASCRIVTANRAALLALGKGSKEVEGRLGGDAFDCQYADLPEGCGNTMHCKTCTIRRTVSDTLRSGRSHEDAAAYPDLHHLTGEKGVHFLISTEKVGDAVLLSIDDIHEDMPQRPRSQREPNGAIPRGRNP